MKIDSNLLTARVNPGEIVPTKEGSILACWVGGKIGGENVPTEYEVIDVEIYQDDVSNPDVGTIQFVSSRTGFLIDNSWDWWIDLTTGSEDHE